MKRQLTIEELYSKDVASDLRYTHGISFRKAISAVGRDFIHRFYVAGNMPSRTADAIASIVKAPK